MADGGGVHWTVTEYEGILDEILARLPVKSLMRFRCVCKSWRALISQPYFVTKQFSCAGKGITKKLVFSSSNLVFSKNFVESIDYDALKDGDVHLAIKKLDFPVMFPDSSIKTIVGSCNGLICVEIDLKDIVLWNPSTRDYKVLPKPTIPFVSRFCGFGYDSTTDDYKVMRGGYCYRVGDSEETMVQVFSLKTGSWRTHQGLNYLNVAGHRWGCWLNGVLHWLETTFTHYRPTGSRIISFNLGEEKFQEMLPLPYHACSSYIFSLGYCLCVYMSGFLHNEATGFRIWMMKEYGVKEPWTEVVSSENLPKEYELSLLTPLCILENGDVFMVKTNDYRSLVLYSSKEQTFRNVIKTRYKCHLYGAIYWETLVSPETSNVANI